MRTVEEAAVILDPNRFDRGRAVENVKSSDEEGRTEDVAESEETV